MKSLPRLTMIASLATVAIMVCAQAPAPKYAAGQVWDYHTRPQDAGSRLKIQQVELLDGRPVYHISIIGVHFQRRDVLGTLPHLPVSDITLDASVTSVSTAAADFPVSSAQEGIAEWRQANGGVFTIPISQILQIADDQVSASLPPDAPR